MKSNCCGAKTKVVGDMTKYYECEDCGKACDLIPNDFMSKKEILEFCKKWKDFKKQAKALIEKYINSNYPVPLLCDNIKEVKMCFNCGFIQSYSGSFEGIEIIDTSPKNKRKNETKTKRKNNQSNKPIIVRVGGSK